MKKKRDTTFKTPGIKSHFIRTLAISKHSILVSLTSTFTNTIVINCWMVYKKVQIKVFSDKQLEWSVLNYCNSTDHRYLRQKIDCYAI